MPRCRTAAATIAQAEAPPSPPREAPTPFPADQIFPVPVRRLLDILDEEQPVKEDLLEALQDLQDLHESDRQWAIWPLHIADAKKTKYGRGLFMLLRGIIRCIGQAPGPVRMTATDLLYSLIIGGVVLTRVPPVFVVECGGAGALCRAARETADRTVLQVLIEISRQVPNQMLPALIDGGALDAAIFVLEEQDSTPLDQLAALDFILSLAKRAPAKTAKAGAYDAVKVVDNQALIPRRNKIMNFLRPLVEDDGAVKTNIRIGGLKF